MEKRARTRFLTGVVLAAVFGAGIVLGMAVTREAPGVAAETAAASQEADSASRGRRTPLYMQVNPTEEQKAKLDSLLQDSRVAMRALTKEFHQEFDPRYEALHKEYQEKYGPRYDSIISGTRAAMKTVMTPEQWEKYDSLLARLDARTDSMRNAGDGRTGDGRRGDRGSRDRD